MHYKAFPGSPGRAARQSRAHALSSSGEVIGALGVHIGEAVVHVGAGTGYFSAPLSAVGRWAKRGGLAGFERLTSAELGRHSSLVQGERCNDSPQE